MDGDIHTFTKSGEREWIAVLLLEGFSMLSLGAITEPFALWQKENAELAPGIRLIGVSSQSVTSASGVPVTCELTVRELMTAFNRRHAPRAIIACGPTNAQLKTVDLVKALLRRAKRARIQVYGIGQVVRSMADCGVLNGTSVTLHWKSLAAFRESFPLTPPQNSLFTANHKGGTCAGELATLDLTMDMIAKHEPRIASEICDLLLISRVRKGDCTQPGSQQGRLRHLPTVLSEAAKYMADEIESKPTTSEVAYHCGVSVRQLERLFREHLATSPMQYSTSLKIERAQELLSQTDLPLQEVSLASGFGTTSGFAKKFRAITGLSPSQFRSKFVCCAGQWPKAASAISNRLMIREKHLRSIDRNRCQSPMRLEMRPDNTSRGTF